MRLIDVAGKDEDIARPGALDDEVLTLNVSEERPNQILGDLAGLSGARDVGLDARGCGIARLEHESAEATLPIEDRQSLHDELPAVAGLQLGLVLVGNLQYVSLARTKEAPQHIHKGPAQ